MFQNNKWLDSIDPKSAELLKDSTLMVSDGVFGWLLKVEDGKVTFQTNTTGRPYEESMLKEFTIEMLLNWVNSDLSVRIKVVYVRPDRNDIFRTYKCEVSKYVRKDGLRLVKSYGCNGQEHMISYDHLYCDSEGKNVSGGKSDVKPQKSLGPCDFKSCCNLGGFLRNN